MSEDIIVFILASLWGHTTPKWEWVKTKNLKSNVSEHKNPNSDLHDNVNKQKHKHIYLGIKIYKIVIIKKMQNKITITINSLNPNQLCLGNHE